MPQPCVSKGVQGCRLPAFKRPRQPLSQLQAPAMCFLRRSRLPFGRPQTFQTPPQAYMPQPCVSRGVQGCKPVQGNHFRCYRPQTCVFYGVGDCRLAAPQTPQTPPQAYMPQPCVSKGVQGCRLPAFKLLKSARKPVQGNHFRSYRPQPCVFYGVRDCRLAARKSLKPVHRPTCPRQPLSQLQAPAMCFLRRWRLPFGRPQTLQTPPQAYMPQPCVSKGVQGCRLPAFKLLNRPASLSKATTFAATGPSHVFFTAFETAVWPPAKASNPSTGLHTSAMAFLKAFKAARPNGSLERRKKHMAGACSCESGCLEQACSLERP